MFDDREAVLLNPSLIHAWDWRSVLMHNLARPVVNVSYAVDRSIWGFTSFGYHITNVILHITAVGLFYGWCTRALGDGARSGSDQEETPAAGAPNQGLTPEWGGLTPERGGLTPERGGLTPEWGAFFAAAVFALHPVMSAAVGYVSGRAELLAAAGVLAALTLARRAIVASSRTSGVLACVFGGLAIGSSSSAAALPLLVLAYDAWVLRHPGWTLRAARIYAPATLAFGSAMAWHLTTIEASAVPPRGAFENLLTGGVVVWRYLALLLVPRGQALVQEVRRVTSPWDPVAILLLALCAAGIALAVARRRGHPLLAFGVVWFIGTLVPTTSVFPVRDAMAEHRLYLASGGLLLAAASLAGRPLATRRTARVLLAVVLAALAAGTYHRNRVWSDPMALWEESVRRSPGAWQAHWGYGELLREIGRCDRAGAEYEAVLRVDPRHKGAEAALRRCRQVGQLR